jgi:hypothetical protein
MTIPTTVTQRGLPVADPPGSTVAGDLLCRLSVTTGRSLSIQPVNVKSLCT